MWTWMSKYDFGQHTYRNKIEQKTKKEYCKSQPYDYNCMAVWKVVVWKCESALG